VYNIKEEREEEEEEETYPVGSPVQWSPAHQI
jgi:hypothetical protein